MWSNKILTRVQFAHLLRPLSLRIREAFSSSNLALRRSHPCLILPPPSSPQTSLLLRLPSSAIPTTRPDNTRVLLGALRCPLSPPLDRIHGASIILRSESNVKVETMKARTSQPSATVAFSNSFLLGLVLVFFSAIGFCTHSSAHYSTHQAGTSDSNYDGGGSNISAFSRFNKYIMQSYYEKYENLFDSDFQDFVAQELPFGLCEVLPHDLSLVVRPPILHRNLIGRGSHRHLTSSIRVNIKREPIYELPTHHCELIIIERLPSGVFADPFELQHLLQRGAYSDIAVFGDANLELPSFLSNRTAVEVHMDIGHNFLLRHNKESNINVELPLHARYPPLDESGYWEVRFGMPDLFMRCSIEGTSPNQSCLYKMPEINGSELGYGKLVWKIPSGMKAHAGIVSTLTFVAALFSAIAIAATSIFHSGIASGKHLKES